MSKIDTHVVDELIHNINNKKLTLKSDKKMVYDDKSNICHAAKKITTYGEAFKLVEEGKNVYLVNESKKISAYIRCSKTTADSCEFCNIHTRMSKLNNDGLKRYEDIIPNPSDKNRWLATIKDDYFVNMRKKKENLSDPIAMILQNKKSKAYFMLSEYARELILNNLNNEKVSDIKKKISKPLTSKKTTNESSSSRKSAKYVVESDEETDRYSAKAASAEPESDNECVDEVFESSAKKEENEDIEELDGDDFFQVIASNGKTYFINKDDDAYYQNDEDEGSFIHVGVLTETKKKYATIEHDEKHYTIFYNHIHPRKGEISLCIISNKIYDSKMKYIGDGMKKCSGTNYDLKFFDEL